MSIDLDLGPLEDLEPSQVRVTVRGIERLRVRLGTLDLVVAS